MAAPAQSNEGAPPQEGVAAGLVTPELVTPELGLLKKLLFNAEQVRLEALQSQCDAFAAKIGDEARFERSTAEILAGALRKAEVAGHRELSSAIAPLVVAAIRSEIVNSRDLMVEALYPITGRMVAAAVANAFRELADTLERRIDALAVHANVAAAAARLDDRAPLSEVLLEAAQRPRLLRLLALERDSGRLLATWRVPEHGDAPVADNAGQDFDELVGGLIAAISQFSAQAFAREHGELRELDMGASHLLLRASTKTLVAAEFSGEPQAADRRRVDSALFALIEAGPEKLDADKLAHMAGDFALPEVKKPSTASRLVLIGLLAAALVAALYVPTRSYFRDRRIEAAFAEARQAQGLEPWPLTLNIDRAAGKVTVAGLLPPEADAEALRRRLAEAAAPFGVDLRAARVVSTDSADQTAQNVAAREKSAETAVAVLRDKLAALESWRESREARDNRPEVKLAQLARRSFIIFGEGAEPLDAAAAQTTISALAEAVKAGGGLRLIGYSDSTGNAARNLALSRGRAETVARLLVEAGVDPARLVAVGRGDEAALFDEASDQHKRNRRVGFEPLDPEPSP